MKIELIAHGLSPKNDIRKWSHLSLNEMNVWTHLPAPITAIESEAAPFSFPFPIKVPRGTIFLFNDLQNDSLEIWGYQSWKQCENNCGLLLYDGSGSWTLFFSFYSVFLLHFPRNLISQGLTQKQISYRW